MDQLKGLGSQAAQALVFAPKIAMAMASGVATLVLVVVAGLFLAAQPVQAREGVLSMVPLPARARLREVLNSCGRALKGWIKAQLLSMVSVPHGHWKTTTFVGALRLTRMTAPMVLPGP